MTRQLLGAVPAVANSAVRKTDLTAGNITGLAVGANPSASIGLTAINGVSTSWMRADAAPALSVAITPTWSGAHSFVSSAGLPALATATATSGVFICGYPQIALINASGPSNQKAWDFYVDSTGMLVFRSVFDAYSNANLWLTVTRAGGVPALATFNSTVVVTGTGSLLLVGSSTQYSWSSSTYTIDIGAGGAVFSDTGGSISIANNLYAYALNAYAYKSAAASALFQAASGAFNWSTAPTGSGLGQVATLTSRMTLSNAGALTVSGGVGVNGVTAPAQVTGWGTPTGAAVTNNFSGTAATTAQIQSAIAKIITDLKAFGLYAA